MKVQGNRQERSRPFNTEKKGVLTSRKKPISVHPGLVVSGPTMAGAVWRASHIGMFV